MAIITTVHIIKRTKAEMCPGNVDWEITALLDFNGHAPNARGSSIGLTS